MPTIDAARVTAIFMDCLFREGEDTTTHVKAPGIVHAVGFHPERLSKHKEEIKRLLAELPDQFMAGMDKGGGWSFLQMCSDKHGEQWGEHLNAEQLVQLGEGIGAVTCLMPREMWEVLPGGMPYYAIDLREGAEKPKEP